MDATLLIAATITLATLIRSTFGFGDALFAVPLLGMITSLQLGVPVLAAIGFTTTAIICLSELRSIEWPLLGTMLLASIPGLPIGLYVLTQADSAIVLQVLGMLISSFALHSLFMARPGRTIDRRYEPIFGFAGGVLGGAFNMFGLPVAIYGGLRRWTPVQFRLLVSSFFLPIGVLGLIGHWYAGFWTAEFRSAYLVTILPSIAALFLGQWINRRIEPGRFNRLIWVIVLLLGLMLVFRNL